MAFLPSAPLALSRHLVLRAGASPLLWKEGGVTCIILNCASAMKNILLAVLTFLLKTWATCASLLHAAHTPLSRYLYVSKRYGRAWLLTAHARYAHTLAAFQRCLLQLIAAALRGDIERQRVFQLAAQGALKHQSQNGVAHYTARGTLI